MHVATDRKILVVEDDQSLRHAVVATLKRQGFQVIEAADGQEGLATALSEHPDLILLDQLMPTMNGMSMLEALREDEWGVSARVILTTNVNETEMVNRALVQNVKQYLVKSDISLESLVGHVNEMLGINPEEGSEAQTSEGASANNLT